MLLVKLTLIVNIEHANEIARLLPPSRKQRMPLLNGCALQGAP